LRRNLLWEFWDKAKAEDEAWIEFEERQRIARGGFAESTLEATKWLKKFYPKRLKAWYEKHPGLQKHVELKM